MAGFTREQLDVTIEESQLVIRGRQQDDKTRQYLHRGIAARQFQRTFVLADGMEVLGADLKNGCCRSIWRGRSPSAWSRRSPSGTTSDGNKESTVDGKESRAMNTTNTLRHPRDFAGSACTVLAAARSPMSGRSAPRTCRSMFPQAPELAPGALLYALHAADGTPIMLTDSREAAVANAWSKELETVSVH